MASTIEGVKKRPAKGPRVAIAQGAPTLGDVETNLEQHREAVARAQEESVDVLVFPELSTTGYRLKDTVPDVAAMRGGPLFTELAALSERVALLVGLVEEDSRHHFFNAAAYFEDGKLVTVHRKVYLPTYGMFDEQRYFARGNRVAAFDTKHGRVAVLICEDMLHPSALMIAALDGAATVFVPSASPSRGVLGEGEVDANGRHWEAYCRTMARNLGLHIVYANRVGVEDGQTFWGGSEIVGPDGEPLAKAAYYEPDFIAAVLADESVRRRRMQSPVLRDEDLDLTINELMRLRGRPELAAREDHGHRGAGRDGRRDDRRGDRRGDPRGDRRGDPRDDRRDDRRADRRDPGPPMRGRGGAHDRATANDETSGDSRRGAVPPRGRPERGARKARPVDASRAVAGGDEGGEEQS